MTPPPGRRRASPPRTGRFRVGRFTARPAAPPAAVVAGALAIVVTLAGCSSTVDLDPAPEADTVSCADVIVHLPKSVDSLAMRETDAQGTSAWGSPTAVLLRCGITTPSVSAMDCVTIDGVDWLVQQAGKAEKYSVYTTYGRNPGVQVVIDPTKANQNVLYDLSSAVGVLKKSKVCL